MYSRPIDEAAILKLIEGDYDPDKFEKTMQEAFGDDFYEKEDAEWKTDEDVQRTLRNDGDVEYVDMEDEDGDEQEVAGEDEEGDYGEDYDEEEGYDDNKQEQETETEIEKKVRAKMMDKLYELDYEDIVAGMPTRFKYREVEPNNYGLSTEEILLARDQTLKQFVSLKKMAPYREEGEYHVSSRKRRKFREMLQQDIEETEKRLKEQGITVQDNHNQASNEESGTKSHKKKRRRTKKNGQKSTSDQQAEEKHPESNDSGEPHRESTNVGDDTAEGKKSKRRRKKKGKKLTSPTDVEIKGATELEVSVDRSEAVDSSSKKVVAEETTNADRKKQNIKEQKHSEKSQKKEKKKSKKAKVSVDGVSAARLASYGL